MRIKNYLNTVKCRKLHEKILEVYNGATLKYKGVKRPSRLKSSNIRNIMGFIAKNVDLEDALNHIKNNSVVDGVVVSLDALLTSFSLNGSRYYHGITATKIIAKAGGVEEAFAEYHYDVELEDFINNYDKEPEVPEIPEQEPEEKEKTPEDYVEEDEEAEVPEAEIEVSEAEIPAGTPIRVVKEEISEEKVTEIVEKVLTPFKDEVKTEVSEEVITKAVKKALEQRAPEKVIIVNGEEKKLKGELYHKQFNQILSLINAKQNIYLYGEAGNGKTFLVTQVAKSLGLELYTQTPGDVISLLGYSDINGVFQETSFTLWVKNGGLLYFSEFDNCGDSILSINTALANGFITINNKREKLNANCVFVADGNTRGNGGDSYYTGRNAIDAATLDRFIFVELENDDKLELAISGYNEEWSNFIVEFRNAVAITNAHCLITMRASEKVKQLETINYPVNNILTDVVLKGMEKDTATAIYSNMFSLTGNKYYEAFSTIIEN